MGKFPYLPVPSSHDSDTAYDSKFRVAIKFLGSAEVNCKLVFKKSPPRLKFSWPTVSIADLRSSVLNLIRTLEGYKILSEDPLSLTISNISSLPVFYSNLSGWLYIVESFSGNKK